MTSTTHLPLGETHEIEPGVVVQRRDVLTTIATLFAAAGLPGMARAARLDPARDAFSYDDFLKEAVPVAKQLAADASITGQDRYLLTLASIAVRLADVPEPDMRANGEGTTIGANPGGDPFNVLHWRMQPGSRIHPHPHIYGNVVTLGLEGEARIHNYEVVGARDYDTNETFRVRRTVDQWLTPGGINLVNLERNYVHGFVAGPRGARGIDITTRIRGKVPSPTLELDPEPVDAAASIWSGRWKY